MGGIPNELDAHLHCQLFALLAQCIEATRSYILPPNSPEVPARNVRKFGVSKIGWHREPLLLLPSSPIERIVPQVLHQCRISSSHGSSKTKGQKALSGSVAQDDSRASRAYWSDGLVVSKVASNSAKICYQRHKLLPGEHGHSCPRAPRPPLTQVHVGGCGSLEEFQQVCQLLASQICS